jgi:HSP20 family molecular chaperone IbpA
MSDQKDIQVTEGRTERTESGPTRTPFVDIHETEEGLTLVAEMAGVDAESLQVEVERGVLTISGQAKAPELGGLRPVYEGMAVGGEFFRAFALSDEIDREKTAASLKDGLLTVTLPKAPEARTRKIPVQPG